MFTGQKGLRDIHIAFPQPQVSAEGRAGGSCAQPMRLVGPHLERATCVLVGRARRVLKQGMSPPWAAGRVCPVSSRCACCSCTDVSVTVEALKEEASINTAGRGCSRRALAAVFMSQQLQAVLLLSGHRVGRFRLSQPCGIQGFDPCYLKLNFRTYAVRAPAKFVT